MAQESAAESSGGVPALIRAHAILDLVTQAETAPTVSVLARQLDLPKSTVHGLCATMVNLGILVRRQDNSFRIGPHVMRWSNAFVATADLVAEFSAIFDEIDVLTQETITLSVLEGAEVMYIACRNSTLPLGITFRIGMRLPAPFTATGKAILSTMPAKNVRAIMANRWPQPLTANSVPDLEALLSELDETRDRGFSIDNGQVREGMTCLGVPVRNSVNKVVAGVAVSFLSMDVDQPTLSAMAKNIRKVADLLSVRLGADVGAPI
ncbi:MAG TPA: IclR family transcriptional regulator [Bauldia sp.]|nr:IclR family transcriptional regulator [Bauldia sp.]